MIEILLVDDHPSVMEGTKVLLEQEKDMFVKLANTPERALELVRTTNFDVMLIDMHMPGMNGIDLAGKILEIKPDAVMLIYTGFEVSNHFNLILETGLAGFVSKTSGKEQLVTAVRCALRGEVVLPLTLVKQLRRVTPSGSERTTGAAMSQSITDKEYSILKEIARGKSNKEIAGTVIMSQRSLEYCLTNLFQKLSVKSRIEAALKAKQMGILSDLDFVQTS
ncbi:response regulator transcription factor [Paenibacillus solani]|uniref:LuxR family transcriptional regulator n=1 Tax=Paenibacillus solani TaxID=1705565 RepID=A0A0M1P970_9BACL|nr:response regulator transcription factor [Paenibacillus solani]KOR90604.1 LuxR family transcriptional regulator [Paenibacillus solani]